MPSDSIQVDYVAPPFDDIKQSPISAGPFIFWDATAFLFKKLFSNHLSNLILPAQQPKWKEQYQTEDLDEILSDLNNSPDLIAQKLFIKTHDGAILNGVEIKHQNKPPSSEAQKYIIYFQGNGGFYENAIKYHHDNEILCAALKLNCNVVTFNYRGVGNSTGKAKSKDDLVTDGLAIVQYLINEKKIKPEHIVLHGYSLGGAIATLVAERLHDRGMLVSTFNSRTFSTITRYVTAQFRTGNLFNPKHPEKQSGHQESFFGKIASWTLMPIVKLTLWLTNWEIDVAKAYSQLPKEKKAYVFSRSPKKLRKENANIKDDVTIPHSASLHEGREVKAQRKKEKNAIRNQVLDMFYKPLTWKSALDFFSDERSKKAIDEKKKKMTKAEKTRLAHLLAQEKAFSDTKLTVKPAADSQKDKVGYVEFEIIGENNTFAVHNAHNVPSSCLWNREEKNEEQIFQEFFQRTTATPAA